jgi:hypothetical protein
MAAEQRHAGRLDDARRTADRMLALCRLFEAENPQHPLTYQALSEAYTQMYKNSWRTDDLEAVEHNMRLSLEAALRAQALDPHNEVARSMIYRRQQGLRGLELERAATK